jgi:hypothetical protein
MDLRDEGQAVKKDHLIGFINDVASHTNIYFMVEKVCGNSNSSLWLELK